MKSSFSIIIVFLALALTGALLVPSLPVKLFPSRELPELRVSFSMPGNSPRVVESEVTSRLEGALARVGGVKEISSESGNGYGNIRLGLDRNADIDKVRLEVSAAVRQLWGSFPPSATYPAITSRQASDGAGRPFMTWSISSPMNPDEIARYADEVIKPRIADIGGVAAVEIRGAAPMEWSLEYDAELLRGYGITPSDIADAIRSHYDSAFAGTVAEDGGWVRVVTKGRGLLGEFNPDEISVTTPRGETVALSRLVTPIHREQNPTGYFRVNGLNSIYLNVTSAKTANQLELSDAVAEEMESVVSSLPEGMEITLLGDSTERIREELSKIYFRTGLTVLILLLFIVLVTRNVRYTLLTVISLTVNLAVAVILYKAFRTEIQLYSLAGITISLNLIIDNIIVMCDHYMRHGNRRAFPAILAATLTTAGALLVVFLLDERSRLNLEDFVIVVVVNLGVSLAVALFLVPALAQRMMIRAPRKPGHRGMRLKAWLCRFYRAYIRFSLRWRVAFVIIALGGLGASGWFFFDKVREGQYWGRNEGEITVHAGAALPNGATLEQMNALVTKMEEFIDGYEGVRQYQTDISSGRRAEIDIWFTKEAEKSGLPLRLKSDLISRALTIGGGSWSIWGVDDNGFNNSVFESAGSYRIKMTGPDYDRLTEEAACLRDSLLTRKRIKEVLIRSEFSYSKDDYSEFRLRPDMDALDRAGISLSAFFDAVEPAFGRDIPAGDVVTGGHRENITLSARQGREYDVWALLNIPVETPAGVVKVSQLASLVREQSPQKVVKENQSYVLCLQYEYIGSPEAGHKLLDEDLERFSGQLSPGYTAKEEKYGGRDDEDYSRYWLLALVITIIFFLGSILFNSLRKPFAVIAMIPISYIGIFVTFIVFHLKFDQGGFASFILLGGITVNAAIYIINEMDNVKRMHPLLGDEASYMRAFRAKITPIMMTVVSTVLGFIPFLVGTDKEGFWFPLAAGTIGGLVFSLLAVALYLPLLLLRRRNRRHGRHRSRAR